MRERAFFRAKYAQALRIVRLDRSQKAVFSLMESSDSSSALSIWSRDPITILVSTVLTRFLHHDLTTWAWTQVRPKTLRMAIA